MFCSNCGTSIEGGRFCPNCGAPVIHQPTPAPSSAVCSSASPVRAETGIALPQGITRSENGEIGWIWSERDYTLQFRMDEARIGYRCVPNPKEATVGSAFKELVKGGLELAADMIVMNSDAYIGQDLPWDSTDGSPGSIFLTFSAIKKIKAIPKKNEIKLKENISSITLRLTAQQYPFVLDYVTRHAPHAVIK